MSLRKEEAVQNALNRPSPNEESVHRSPAVLAIHLSNRPSTVCHSHMSSYPAPNTVAFPKCSASHMHLLPAACAARQPHPTTAQNLPRRQPCSQPSHQLEVTSINPWPRALLSNTGITTFVGSDRRAVCAISITIGQGYEQQKTCAMQGQRSQHFGDHTSGRRRWRWSCMRLAFQMNPMGARCLDRVGGVGRFSGGQEGRASESRCFRVVLFVNSEHTASSTYSTAWSSNNESTLHVRLRAAVLLTLP
jgi:hypothetical protein